MFIKKGNLEESNDTKNMLLRNPDGKLFEVSYMAAFIWDKLDGNTTTKEVSNIVKSVGKVETPELPTIVQNIIEELSLVGLVQDNSK